MNKVNGADSLTSPSLKASEFFAQLDKKVLAIEDLDKG